MRTKTIIASIVTFASVVCLTIAQTTNAPTDKWQAPPEAAAKHNPEAKNASASAVGRKVFMRTCAVCHAEDGSGQNSSGANLRSPETQGQSDGALFWKITNGNTANGMPSFTALRESDRWDIVTFLRTLRESNGNGSESSDECKKGAPPDSEKHKQQ